MCFATSTFQDLKAELLEAKQNSAALRDALDRLRKHIQEVTKSTWQSPVDLMVNHFIHVWWTKLDKRLLTLFIFLVNLDAASVMLDLLTVENYVIILRTLLM